MKTNLSPTALALLAAVPLLPLRAASLTPLGDLPGGSSFSFASGISADGGTIVGHSESANGTEAFRWQGGTMTGLGDLPGGSFNSAALGVSADGGTIVGRSSSANGAEAFRWQSGTMTGLGDLPGGFFNSAAYGVSADGSVIVGYGSSANGPEAFRWQGGTMTGLGDLSGGVFESAAWGVSADGSTVVGYSYSANGAEAFRRQGGTLNGLGDLPGGPFQSYALGASADGGTIVGYSATAAGIEAFRWRDGTMTGLGDLPGGVSSSLANAVSADGDVVVGQSSSTNGAEAFLWTSGGGMRSLASRLLAGGVDPAAGGWSVLTDAHGISADGRYVAGTGVHTGNTEAFLVDLGPVDHPPVVANPLANQPAALDAAFSFTVPADTFTDPDAGQTLIYSATGLPAWLSFNAATRTFSGTPTAPGTAVITVTATDNGEPALAASTTFTITAGFSAQAVVARYNFVANGWSGTGVPNVVRGSFTTTFEPVSTPSGNGFSVAQLDAVVFQVNGVTYTPQNTGVVVQNGRRAGAGGVNHEGYFTLGGLTGGSDAYGISSATDDFVLQFSDSSGTFFNPSFSFSKAGAGIFVATSVTVTRASAAPVFTARYNFTATDFSPAAPQATVSGSFTATFKHTGGNGVTGWVPSVLEALNVTINGVSHALATTDLNVRNVTPGGANRFSARFEIGAGSSAYGEGGSTDDFHLYFTDFGSRIEVPQFVYTVLGGGQFYTAATVAVTRVAADPLAGADLEVEQPAGSYVYEGQTTVDFGRVAAGGSSSRIFTLKNRGVATLTDLSATTIGPAAADYTVTTAPAVSLAGPAGETTVAVTFSPVSNGGTRSATLRLRSSDPRENPFDIPLTAVAEVPEIVVEQPAGAGLTDGVSTVGFGPADVALGSLTRTFTVRNTGSGRLTFGGVTVTGGEAGDFTVDTSGLAAEVGPGGSTTFTVTFNPAATGPRAAALHIASNDADEASFDVALTGTGIVNNPPVANGDTLTRLDTTTTAKVLRTALLANDTDPDGDPRTITAVGGATPVGATVALSGLWVIYTVPSAAAGAGGFTYTLSDGPGGHTATGTVTVAVSSAPTGPPAGPPNPAAITLNVNDVVLTFVGVPGRSYRVQYTTSTGSPYVWQEFAPPVTYTTPANGVFTHTDADPPSPQRFYRTVANP